MKMQNKRAKEEQARAEHRAQRQAQKASRQPQDQLARPAAPTRAEREPQRILLVCQGEETEITYFNLFVRIFRLTGVEVHPHPFAQDPRSLVEEALRLKQDSAVAGKPYAHIWCVFDKDDSDANQFNGAVARAQAQGLGLAYSNQAFEFWLLLHFQDHPRGGLHRDVCRDKLLEHLPAGVGFEGSKRKQIGRAFFDVLTSLDPATRQPRTQLAIRRAEAIATEWEQEYTPAADQESTTLMYALARQLLSYQPA